MPARDEIAAHDVVKRFDLAADRYESWYETPQGARMAREERQLLGSLLGPGPKKGKILEVGCGTGYFTEWLDKRYAQAVGLDPSKAMLRDLRRRGRNFQSVRGEGERLPFADGAFETVVFATTLEFVADPDAALSEAVRVAQAEVAVLWLNPWSLGALRRMWAAHRLLSMARHISVLRARRMLIRAARGRSRGVEWASALFPWPFLGLCGRIPLGDVLAIKVALAPAGTART